jgi:hypothetical protein
MRLLIIASLVFVLAGCGASSHTSSPSPPQPAGTTYPLFKTAAPIPHCAEVHELGGCIRAHFGVKPRATLGPVTSAGPCADYSQWQGSYPNLSGVRCAIFQANYGTSREPSIYWQMRDAREHGVPFGCYTFEEPGVGGEAEAVKANEACPASAGRQLGLWADAEVNGVYERTCPYVRKAAQFTRIAGKYSSPGLDQSGYCGYYDWPAEWGGAAYPLRGYSWSATVLRQFCGTCWLNGHEQDLDEDRGLIALGTSKPAPPKPPTPPSVLKARLRKDLAVIKHLHILIHRHECWLDQHHHWHGQPHTHAIWVDCFGRHGDTGWVEEGQDAHADARSLERHGVKP